VRRRLRQWGVAAVAPFVLAVLAVVAVVALPTGCSNTGRFAPVIVVGGDASQGKRLIQRYGCGTCHTIPGVRGANALVGPPLTHWARRSYIGGILANTPDNLVNWIQHPREILPGVDMPDLGVTPDQARSIAAYLVQIR
jgi:cytochrome c